MIKLRMLRWEDDPELSQWAIMQSESIYNAIRERQKEILHRRGHWKKAVRSRIRERRCTLLALKIKEEAMSQGKQGMQL